MTRERTVKGAVGKICESLQEEVESSRERGQDFALPTFPYFSHQMRSVASHVPVIDRPDGFPKPIRGQIPWSGRKGQEPEGAHPAAGQSTGAREG